MVQGKGVGEKVHRGGGFWRLLGSLIFVLKRGKGK